MEERTKMMWALPVAGFLIVVAFGLGVIATAAYDSHNPFAIPGQAAATTDDEQVIEVELGDLFIKPTKLEAQAGAIRFEVTNNGKTEHNFAIEGLGGTEMIPPGESATLQVASVNAGSYTYICEVSGHAQGGMTGTLTVGGSTETADSGHDMAAMSLEEMVKHDAAVTGSFPAETKGSGGRPLKPEMTADGTKVFVLTADEISWEVEPGKMVDAMAYNGQIPALDHRARRCDPVAISDLSQLRSPIR